MSIPRSVTKITKDGVTFTSNVDRVNYTMKELVRAALRDTGKYVCRTFKQSYYREFKKHSGRVGRYTQYFVRWKQEDVPNLQVGIKPNAFYGGFQEIGTSKTRKHGLLTKAVEENVNQIRDIQAQYLTAIEDEQRALSLISEDDYEGGADD